MIWEDVGKKVMHCAVAKLVHNGNKYINSTVPLRHSLIHLFSLFHFLLEVQPHQVVYLLVISHHQRVTNALISIS